VNFLRLKTAFTITNIRNVFKNIAAIPIKAIMKNKERKGREKGREDGRKMKKKRESEKLEIKRKCKM
jgi:hypothetical protein